ncbi:MAG: nitroreductase [Eubacteriaceae bacterium]|nr:nitroreductase [Eubacteriaceae bacterium]
MNEIIMKRKSIRDYNMSKLSGSALGSVREMVAKATPLYPDIKYSIEIVDNTKGIFGIKAPHYLAFYSEAKDGDLENIGFIGQQMDLFFSGSGYGSCWLGMAKPKEKTPSYLPFVISMAFGKPAEPLHRDISDFKRKTLEEISQGDDARLESARLAPSAMNKQNWYFIALDGKIHCYIKKLSGMQSLVNNKFGHIDMGIALCHIAKESEGFAFSKESNPPECAGFEYSGTVLGS